MTNKSKPEPKLLSVLEYAKLSGIGRQAVWKQIKAGKLHAEKVGRSWVIKIEKLEK
jgi:excisionase family DNA binding protein